jgi:hypothetical protein
MLKVVAAALAFALLAGRYERAPQSYRSRVWQSMATNYLRSLIVQAMPERSRILPPSANDGGRSGAPQMHFRNGAMATYMSTLLWSWSTKRR